MLMERAEMLERLNNGEEAIDLSIEKWERIISYIKSGDVDVQYIGSNMNNRTCALCEKYDQNCDKCPLRDCEGRGYIDILDEVDEALFYVPSSYKEEGFFDGLVYTCEYFLSVIKNCKEAK